MEQLTDASFHAAGNLQGPGDSAASLSPAHAPCHLFFQALPLPKDSVTSFCCGAESPGLRGTHEEEEGSSDVIDHSEPTYHSGPLPGWKRGVSLRGIPMDPTVLIPRDSSLHTIMGMHVIHVLLIITDHVLQATIQHGAGVSGTSEGGRRWEKLCPAPLHQSYNPNLT